MKLLLVDTKDLPLDDGDKITEDAVRAMVTLVRGGMRLLFLGRQPERWRPTRKSMDDELEQQQVWSEQLQAAGIHLDGVYYLPSHLIEQKKDREEALGDIIGRYGKLERSVLVSSVDRYRDTAESLGMVAVAPVTGVNQTEALVGVLGGIVLED